MKNATILKELIESSPEISILYVEDDDQLRSNTLRLLSTFFKTIDIAVDGQEGLDKYQAGSYDLVISDLRMPVMDGIEMVRRIKEINGDQLVVITSAHDESNYLLELISMEVENFILKPLDVSQLLSVLIKTVKFINLRKMESEYKHRLENTVRLRTAELFQANKKLEEINATLEQKVAQRTEELKVSLAKVEVVNKRLLDSIEYAKMIQRSLLPNLLELSQHLPKSFVIWLPRDGVGGDIYHTDFFEDNFIISVIDCTGHGVPGALMTMIASSGLRRIIRDEQCLDPAEILKRLNFFIKTSLQQDTEYALSNDGLDAAVCHVERSAGKVHFAGARLPLVYVLDGRVHVVRGDRVSIGYKKSDLSYRFSQKSIVVERPARFYLFTDGYFDQIGEISGFGFGQKRFINLLQQSADMDLQTQKDHLLKTFFDFRGKTETRDDVTIVGFEI